MDPLAAGPQYLALTIYESTVWDLNEQGWRARVTLALGPDPKSGSSA